MAQGNLFEWLLKTETTKKEQMQKAVVMWLVFQWLKSRR